MARCIDCEGKQCRFLQFNQKGNYNWHCNWNPRRPVIISEIDVRVDLPCPIDLYKNAVSTGEVE